MTKTRREDDEENTLKEALLSHANDNDHCDEEIVDDYAHWSPCKKAIVLFILFSAMCFKTWQSVRSWVEPNQVLPLLEGSQALLLADDASSIHYDSKEQEDFLNEDAMLPMEFDIVKMQDVLNKNSTSFQGPIPPFHPHHTATVTYSSRMGPDGSVEYRRDINAPCDNGMLIFSVGPAKDELPYTYELYNDAYLYSDNNGLCVLYPSYNGYQTSKVPLWNPTDPLQVSFNQLDKGVMHWISSRVFDPYRSKKKWDRTKVGDYAIIAKHNFYDVRFFEGLKAEINSWK